MGSGTRGEQSSKRDNKGHPPHGTIRPSSGMDKMMTIVDEETFNEPIRFDRTSHVSSIGRGDGCEDLCMMGGGSAREQRFILGILTKHTIDQGRAVGENLKDRTHKYNVCC